MTDTFVIKQDVNHTVVAPANRQTYHTWDIVHADTGKLVVTVFGPNSYPAVLALCELYNKLGTVMPVQLVKED